jgi:hypothetical protein
MENWKFSNSGKAEGLKALKVPILKGDLGGSKMGKKRNLSMI